MLVKCHFLVYFAIGGNEVGVGPKGSKPHYHMKLGILLRYTLTTTVGFNKDLYVLYIYTEVHFLRIFQVVKLFVLAYNEF